MKVYSSNGCPKCKLLKAKLNRDGVKFEDIELDPYGDEVADLILKNIYISSFPAVDIDGMIFVFAGENK